ncbi:MAG: hypothetical protein IK080_04355 [Clostridia bacterium]|nr:hypothetical protein [Clostridia bacterium]
MWKNINGSAVFAGGKEAFEDAAQTALRCPLFRPDSEEEWTAEEARSCYNCRYRRWTKESFQCVKGGCP